MKMGNVPRLNGAAKRRSRNRRHWKTGIAGLTLAFLGGPAAAAPQTELLWGDTHLHTSYSADAYGLGTLTVDPETAYRFARGLPVIHPGTGAWVRLERPLDFLVVSDHAELLGVYGDVQHNSNPAAVGALGRSGVGRALLRIFRAGISWALWARQAYDLMLSGPEARAPLTTREVIGKTWADTLDAADRNYQPGKFTTFVGWEWTGDGVSNLHRVVVTTASGKIAKSFLPFSAFNSRDPRDLWKFLGKQERATRAEFIGIPHNSNLSNGRMFSWNNADGTRMTRANAQIRARWEPMVEVTQTKGTSETIPTLSPNDEFANFEGFNSGKSRGSYVRSALLTGMEIERALGVNPYKLGMIAGTDIHTGLSAPEATSFQGVAPSSAQAVRLPDRPIAGEAVTGWDISASGRAAVWATANTREAIMAAFRRREVYATTGPRIRLRVFGGFRFSSGDAHARDIAGTGYAKGVPMGGDLTHAPAGRRPGFLIDATRDPLDGNLDRVQVVKGWLDENGKSHERVYDVAWSGARRPDRNGRLPPVGNTVDEKTARYTNTIGSPELLTLWSDPDFDPNVRAFYYVRVLQIPTPRYSLYSAIALGLDPKDTGHPATIQERAYSSPIWYTP